MARPYDSYSLTFEYNEDGLRTKKTSSTGYVSEYTWHGTKLTHMKRNTTTMHFFYDAQGRPATLRYGTATYGYLYNLQGDVVAIVDSTGAKVVEYTYDAWGKQLSCTGSKASTVGTYQPFRYRGYIYDFESGLYYLRSRYYNPTWGRFINADVLVKGNLFRYCSNNPLNKYDNNGFYDRFAGEDFSVGDRMQHVLKKSSNELMSIDDFMLLLYDMENWKYANEGCSYGISISDGCRNEVTVNDEKYRNEFVFTIIIRMYH